LAIADRAFTNLPLEADTWGAMQQLVQQILDPVVDRYGEIDLTYAFASLGLTRRIGRNIAPALDQHAGCELNSAGAPICKRHGQACDFRVPNVASSEVVRFIAAQLPFDRMYFYGDDRPIHVSWGPQPLRSVFTMLPSASGRRIPRAWKDLTSLKPT
jgi:hypothetical protein